MSGRASRSKGRRGQTEFANLLRSRDWDVADITSGVSAEDILATDPHGRRWCVEVKNTITSTPIHVQQAKEQARRRGSRWMLAWHIPQSSAWLVRGTGMEPVIWRGSCTE